MEGKGGHPTTGPRLHVEDALRDGTPVALDQKRTHYLAHVLRLKPGASLRLFNARDGEWAARLDRIGRQDCLAVPATLLREPAPELGPVLVLAPIRRNRLDWVIEKATELGVSRIVSVMTRYTQVRIDKAEHLRAIAVEAAEQCERLSVPAIEAPQPLGTWLGNRDPARPLYLCDEAGGPLLANRFDVDGDLLIGPEGGWAEEERALLTGYAGAVRVGLGPRILRAETAALVALTMAMVGAARRA
ncbi:MAG: 16S rRNA (uracil(1498)-N(3))-methyltransferase [Geminicoccaceae bacterium]